MARKYKRGTGKTGRKNKSPTSATTIANKKRLALILEWRVSGFTLDEIAEALPTAGFQKLSGPRIHQIIAEAMSRQIEESTESLLFIENMRLEKLTAAHFDKAAEGDALATSSVLAIHDRKCRLHGIGKAKPNGEGGGSTSTDVTIRVIGGLPED